MNTSATFARAHAFQLAQTLTESRLRWVATEGGDHCFLTPTGAEIRVDLVLRRASWWVK